MAARFRLQMAALGLMTALLPPSTARGDPCLTASFTGPVTAGATATLSLSEDPSCYPNPSCLPLVHYYGELTTDWGDGTITNGTSHTYVWPGHYHASLVYYWKKVGTCGETTSGTVQAATDVDVQLNMTNGWIGVYLDPTGTSCSGPVFPGTTLYVVAGLTGTAAIGVAGADFRVRASDPSALHVTESPAEGWIEIGQAFGTGATLATGSCGPTGGRVNMVKAVIYPLSQVSDLKLYVETDLNPPNPSYTAPILVLCDAPTFTAVVAGRGYPAVLNPTTNDVPCTNAAVAVQQRTWSQVKNLFR